MSHIRLARAVIVMALVAFVVASCGKEEFVNKAWKEKNAKGVVWAKQQGIVLPIDIHGFGDSTVMRVAIQGALMAGIVGTTLDENKIPRWISLQPAIAIPPFNENLSHEMCWNVRHMIEVHNTFDPKQDIHGGSAQPVVKLVLALPGAVTLGLAMAEKAIQEQLKKPDFKIAFTPRFLIGAHVDSDGVTTVAGKGLNKAHLRAFMYDASAGEYAVYAEWTSSMPYTGQETTDKGILIGKFGTIGADILGNLIGPLT